ncbi:MAG: PKD domain-containing protein, partial [Blastocatellia bacterium]
THVYADGLNNYTVSATATDEDGTYSANTRAVTVNNVAPTLTINGPATVLEGSDYVLTLNSADPGADTISSWTITWGDGSPVQTVMGNPSSVSHVYANGLNNYTISATATDEDGSYSANMQAVTVNNARPIPKQNDVLINGQSLGGNTTEVTVVPGLEVTFVVSTTDPAFDHLDAPFGFTLNFGDGSPSVVMTATQEGQLLEFKHVYTQVGQTYQPTLTVRDEATTPPSASSLATTIDLAEVTVDRQAVIDGALFVGGSESSDRIIVSGDGSVRFNGTPLPKAWPGERLVIFGNGGNDTISTSGVHFPVEFYGGAGNDYLAGGTSDDILDGGDDNDRILGGNGNDILLGGNGNDRLSGGSDDDYAFGDHMFDPTVDTTYVFSFNDGEYEVELPIRVGNQPGRDTISGDNGNDTLDGGPQNDSLTGGNGDDLIRGGDGNDRLDGGNNDDLLLGEAGADLLYGRGGNDILIGGAGLDTLYGYSGDDLLYGGDLFDGNTNEDLQDLWMLWRSSGQEEDALTALEGLFGDDDESADSLHGENGIDWYLLFARDKIRTTAEAKSPNEIRTYYED